MLLHLGGKVIRTTADHPFYVPGQGWTDAANLPTEAKSDVGEQEVVYHLNLGEPAMPDQPHPNFPILGFAAGTPLLTSSGHKLIEQVQPGDLIQTRPDDQGGNGPENVHDEDCDCPDHDSRWWEKN